MRLHLALIAAGSLALAITLVPAAASAAEVSPLPMPSQQPTVAPAHPIIGGHHIQPGATQLQTRGVQAPTSQQTQEMDRLARQLLDESKTKSGMDD
jgi:hypothetical protein